jgi:hypothetical protein
VISVLKITETVLRSRGTVIDATQRIRWREESMHKLRKKQKEAASERGGGCEPPCEPIFKMGIWLIVVAVATSLEVLLIHGACLPQSESSLPVPSK